MEKKMLDGKTQQFIADLKKALLDQWSGYNSFEVLDFEFANSMLSYLRKRRCGVSVEDILITEDLFKDRNEQGHTLFFRKTLPKIRGFARTDAEADILVMTLLYETLEIIASPIYASAGTGWPDESARKLLDAIKGVIFAQWSGYNSFEVLDFEFAGTALAYLEKRRRGFPIKDIIAGAEYFEDHDSFGYMFFFRETLPKISAFAMSGAEADALVTKLVYEAFAIIEKPIVAATEKKGLMSPNLDMRRMES